jgi:N-acetyl-1-D-myo-inositol-2-amino-2-deoxy-alpha-D-glucopyranoside deacetylase
MGVPRLLLVHAHPDDETITTGGIMARYAAAGAAVTLLTCTLGEEGEILVPELAGLAAGAADQLGGYRIAELRAALQALGVTDQRFLGTAGRYRDSGMLGAPANGHPRALWRAYTDPVRFAAAVRDAVDVVRDVRPHVVVTYDPHGGYGHPDHVLAHRIASAAVRAAAESASASWQVAKLYWTAMPSSVMRAEVETVRAAGTPFATPEPGQLPAVDDAGVTTAIDIGDFVDAKLAALSAHRTQVAVHERFYALTNMIGRAVAPTEYFRLAAGSPGDDRDAAGRETDLFSGVQL